MVASHSIDSLYHEDDDADGDDDNNGATNDGYSTPPWR